MNSGTKWSVEKNWCERFWPRSWWQSCRRTKTRWITCVLYSSCRVRPLSESINDLFKEVSQLHRRISELSHRLATLEPYLRRHGYRGDDGEEAGGIRAQKGERVSLVRYGLKNKERASGPKVSRVVRRRRVRILKNGGAASEWIKWTEMEDVLHHIYRKHRNCMNRADRSSDHPARTMVWLSVWTLKVSVFVSLGCFRFGQPALLRL